MQGLAIGEGAHEPEPSGTAEETLGARALQALLGLACVVLVASVGSWVYLRSPAVLTFAPVAGIVAALAVPRRGDAAVAAGLGALLGFAIAVGPVPALRVDPTVLSQLAFAAAAAAAAAFGASWLLETLPRMRRLLLVSALALVVLGMWYAAVVGATTQQPDGSMFVNMMSEAPPIERMTPDEGLYLRYIERLRAGEPYYPMVASVLQEANAKRIGPVDLGTPLSFRLPTLYVALSKLPSPGIFLVLASLAAGTLAVLAAFALSARLASPPVAFASAASVAAFYGSVSLHPNLLDAEPWAGALVLLALALAVFALTGRGTRSDAAMWGAAGAALAAALVRELAAPVLLVGLAAALIGTDTRRRKLWLPWLLALAAAALAYYAHASAALAVIHGLPKQTGLPDVSWLDPTGVGLVAAMRRMSAMLELTAPAAWALAAAAVAGSVAAPRSWAGRLALAGVVACGLAALLVVHPLGVVSNGDRVPSYWADLLTGSLLACAPLVLALAPGARRSLEGSPEVAKAA